ncbi:MAG: hypothetical protein KKE24_03390 [Candidatus Thermoplasmatota archaeon]|nr:hypothetical protein [Candidatus Thermoplasmatota archaeon]
MADDFVAIGAACLVGGGALVALFVHLRSHAERFRKEGRDQHVAMRSRLVNQFFLTYLTKSVQQIDNILKRNPEFAEIRKSLIKAMTEDQDTSEVLNAVKALIEKTPPTPEEHGQLKELTEELTSKFGECEKVSTLYTEGWTAEDKCSSLVLRAMICLLGMGFLILAYSLVGDSFQIAAIVVGSVLILFAGMSSLDANETYKEARNAQLEFNKMVDKELYSLPPSDSE